MVSQFPAFIRQRSVTAYTRPRNQRWELFLRKIRTKLVLPAEEITCNWKGSSEIVRKYRYTNTYSLSIISFAADQAVNYCPVISWDNGDNTKTRYKIWSSVGELLYVPDYAGQLIPVNFAIEIWNTINGNPVVLNGDEFYLSKLILNSLQLYTCCLQENNHLRVWTNSGTGILDELGNIILDEGGNTTQPQS